MTGSREDVGGRPSTEVGPELGPPRRVPKTNGGSLKNFTQVPWSSSSSWILDQSLNLRFRFRAPLGLFDTLKE